ncbi:hypothetical membrane protein [Renibacterium salmoninarum ATCC 33209]|uniref:Hypothetical membrane protein n=1 Tax=Renibacterium salmoninarum (strain ATCC 33209 / DSM 20767 / JCM 11484 / NBRC 15589 / NCIMB 2235) TaxID=288705 RepID=A9WQF6_RENSM|nr:hypothetical membrane protein [Renibacterium salmoninarum ATCC 33209]
MRCAGFYGDWHGGSVPQLGGDGSFVDCRFNYQFNQVIVPDSNGEYCWCGRWSGSGRRPGEFSRLASPVLYQYPLGFALGYWRAALRTKGPAQGQTKVERASESLRPTRNCCLHLDASAVAHGSFGCAAGLKLVAPRCGTYRGRALRLARTCGDQTILGPASVG